MIESSPSLLSPSETAVEFQANSIRDCEPGILHGFTARLPGTPGASFEQAVGDHLSAITDGDSPPLQVLEQYHSTEIHYPGAAGGFSPGNRAAKENFHLTLPKGDGIVLGPSESGLAAIATADCVPVLLHHGELRQVAALHAGWRGAAAGIMPILLEQWARQADDPRTVTVAIGPSIRSCCYEVRSDCLGAFEPAHLDGAVSERNGLSYLEITRVLLNQARGAGLGDDQVEILPQCTCCHTPDDGGAPFASYRRAQRSGEALGARNGSYIGFVSPG